MPASKASSKVATKIERAFCDTSAIVPLCCYQASSAELRRLARKIKRMTTWWGTSVEAHSAFSRLVREGKMTARGLKQAAARLDALRPSWVVVLPSERVRETAEAMPGLYGLRALDSFQLAAALVWCREQPRGHWFVSYDLRLTEAAAKAGFNVLP